MSEAPPVHRGRGPKGLNYSAKAAGAVIFGGRMCPKCSMRKFTLTGNWRHYHSKSGGRPVPRVEVRCMECEYVWWSSSPRVLSLAAR